MALLGTSFTRWRAEALGLDYRRAFERICELGFDIMRLSTSWYEIDQVGYAHLDWLMRHAEHTGHAIVLTVGMKALGWPEFYLPKGVDPTRADTEARAIGHVREVVQRYAAHPQLRGWQIENEPFNRSGPQGRWIRRSIVRREATAVRRLDPSRPLAITTFAHFDLGLDLSSSRHQSKWKRRFGLAIPAEREALSVLRRGDILGVDVYRSIAWTNAAGNQRIASAEPDQLAWLRRWQHTASAQGKRFWIMEAQAEPWEPRGSDKADPQTIAPGNIGRLVEQLDGVGAEAILLWGSEFWVWRERQGDRRWLDALPLGRRALAR